VGYRLLHYFQIEDTGDIGIEGVDAKWVTFQKQASYGRKTEDETPYSYISYVFATDGVRYEIRCSVNPNQFNQMKPLFDEIAMSFKVE